MRFEIGKIVYICIIALKEALTTNQQIEEVFLWPDASSKSFDMEKEIDRQVINPSEWAVRLALNLPSLVFIRNLDPPIFCSNKGRAPIYSIIVPGGYTSTKNSSEFSLSIFCEKYFPGATLVLKPFINKLIDCKLLINYWYEEMDDFIAWIDCAKASRGLFYININKTLEYFTHLINCAVFHICTQEIDQAKGDIAKGLKNFHANISRCNLKEYSLICLGLDENLTRLITQKNKVNYDALKISIENKWRKIERTNFTLTTKWLLSISIPDIFSSHTSTSQKKFIDSLLTVEKIFYQKDIYTKPHLKKDKISYNTISSLFNLIIMLDTTDKITQTASRIDIIWDSPLVIWKDPDSSAIDPCVFVKFRSNSHGIIIQKRVRLTEKNIRILLRAGSSVPIESMPSTDLTTQYAIEGPNNPHSTTY